MKTLLLVCVVFSLVAGCSSGGSPSPSAGPKTLDQPIWDSYCRDASSVLDTLNGIQKGTVTNTEAVTAFAKSENAIHGDSQAAASEGFPNTATRMQAVADAVGRMKVAVSSGSAADPTELGTASQALPNCSAKPPSD